MNAVKKYMMLFLLGVSTSCFSAADEDGPSRGILKKIFHLTVENVLAELHKTYDMYILLCSIADSFKEADSLQRGFGDHDSTIQKFNAVTSLVITGKTVRAEPAEAEVAQSMRAVVDLADQSKPTGEAIEDIATVVSDIHMQEAAQSVASFALTMSKAEHQKKENQSTASYIIDVFVTVFEAAHKAHVFKAVPVILHGVGEVVGDVVDIGENVVHKVGSSGCCTLC